MIELLTDHISWPNVIVLATFIMIAGLAAYRTLRKQ